MKMHCDINMLKTRQLPQLSVHLQLPPTLLCFPVQENALQKSFILCFKFLSLHLLLNSLQVVFYPYYSTKIDLIINVTKNFRMAKFSHLADLTVLKTSQMLETWLFKTGFSQSLQALWLVLFSPCDWDAIWWVSSPYPDPAVLQCCRALSLDFSTCAHFLEGLHLVSWP